MYNATEYNSKQAHHYIQSVLINTVKDFLNKENYKNILVRNRPILFPPYTPSISIENSQIINKIGDLKDSKWQLWTYMFYILGRTKTESNIIADILASFFDSWTYKDSHIFLKTKAIRFFEEEARSWEYPNIEIDSFSYLHFDGFNGYGINQNNELYNTNTLSIICDFSLNKLITSGENDTPQWSYYYNTHYDGYIDTYGSFPSVIDDSGGILHFGQEHLTTHRKLAYLFINTSGFYTYPNTINDFLYFYISSGFYSYEFGVYITPRHTTPLDRSYLYAPKYLVNTLVYTGAGWYSVELDDLTYINPSGLTVFEIQALSGFFEMPAYESGEHNAYIARYANYGFVYENSCIVDKFDDANLAGFRCFVNSGGQIIFERGFGGTSITNITDPIIQTGERCCLNISSKYEDAIYAVNIFLDKNKIYSYERNWFILPVFSFQNLYIGCENIDGILSGFSDINLCGLRIQEKFYDSVNYNTRSENWMPNENDMLYLDMDEYEDTELYDIQDRDQIDLHGNYDWNTYLTEQTYRINRPSISIMELVFEVHYERC